MNINLTLICVACVGVATAAVLSPEAALPPEGTQSLEEAKSPGAALSPKASLSPEGTQSLEKAKSPEAALSLKASLSPEAAFERAMRQLRRRAMMPAARLRLAPAVLAELQDALRTEWPDCWVELYGSTVTGLALIGSDIDMSVAFPPGEVVGPTAELLSHARRALVRSPHFQDIQTIPAFIPILTTTHVPTDFPIDVSFRNILAINNTYLNRYYFELDERAHNLAIIAKCLLNPNHTKEFRSTPKFDLVMLSIFFLQQKGILPSGRALQQRAAPYWVGAWDAGYDQLEFKGNDNTPLYRLVGQFFEYYATFDFDRFVISVYAGRPVAKSNFADLAALPAEFALYKRNVAKGTPPLDTAGVVIQDMFEHNSRTGNHLNISTFTTGAEYYRTLDSVQFLNKVVSC